MSYEQTLYSLRHSLMGLSSSSSSSSCGLSIFSVLICGIFYKFLSVIGRFLDIIGWDPSVCKSNRLHVDILRFFYINLRYIPQIPLKWSVILLNTWTSTGYFSNSTGSSITLIEHSSSTRQNVECHTIVPTTCFQTKIIAPKDYSLECKSFTATSDKSKSTRSSLHHHY